MNRYQREHYMKIINTATKVVHSATLALVLSALILGLIISWVTTTLGRGIITIIKLPFTPRNETFTAVTNS
jgi:flagellar biosynthesis protein FliQ